MKKRVFILLLILSISLIACGINGNSQPETTASTSASADCQSADFDKSALVFDTILICGTNGVSQEKLTHAANVTAEWLDNDEDGTVDEPRLLEAMKKNRPIVIMTGDVLSNRKKDRLYNSFGDNRIQDLGAAETNPDGDRRDASQEEIHHIIMNAGWQSLFPNTFSEIKSDNSKLYTAWKFANDNGYYAYDDPTCDDSCKVTEFVYLATAAYLGSAKDLESDEMRLKTRDALRQTIPAVVEIFESDDYVYPTSQWPDGSYTPVDKITFLPGTP